MAFQLTDETVWPDPPFPVSVECGAMVSFLGRVRNRNEGRRVASLEYSAYRALAQKEGDRIVEQATRQFQVAWAACAHRLGRLQLGDVAVGVWVAAEHRDAAFAACRFIIDEIKARVPIWKKECYTDGTHGWVACHSESSSV